MKTLSSSAEQFPGLSLLLPQVLAYEALHTSSCPVPRLKKFMGKPNELSPKARLLNFVVRARAARSPVFADEAVLGDAVHGQCHAAVL